MVKAHIAQEKDRRTLIFKKKPQNKPDRKISNPPIHKWIRQSKKYLERNEKAKELGKNIQIAYKQPKKHQETGRWGGGGYKLTQVA